MIDLLLRGLGTGASVRLPGIEAVDVQVKDPPVCVDALYHELLWYDGGLAAFAGLHIAAATAQPRETVMRESAVGELLSDDETKALLTFRGGTGRQAA